MLCCFVAFLIPDSLHRLADDGGGKRDRTDDPLLAKQVLYQLSYAPIRVKVMVCLGGLEPPTPRLSSVYSNQLTYKPRSMLFPLASSFQFTDKCECVKPLLSLERR